MVRKARQRRSFHDSANELLVLGLSWEISNMTDINSGFAIDI